MLDEQVICEIEARRKGKRLRSQAPCTLVVAIALHGPQRQVVLRTLDRSGTPPLVAVLTPEEARSLADGLARAAGAES